MGNVRAAAREPGGPALWLADYRPSEVASRDWAMVRPFVTGLAHELGLQHCASAQRTVRVLTRLALWAAGEGLALDAEVVLDPAVVERFVGVGMVGDRWRATYRAVLRRVGPRLTRKAPWEARPAPAARRQVAVPYAARELDGLRAAALAQPTPGRMRAARALLALGAGAGLDGRWVARVRAGDVTIGQGALLVRVGDPAARVVPVLVAWEREVLELVGTAGGEYLVGGHSQSKNRAGSLAASLVVPSGVPRLSAARLRSTWLVTHLALGTRLPELAAAAGLEGVTVLSDLLAFVPPVGVDERLALLRGER